MGGGVENRLYIGDKDGRIGEENRLYIGDKDGRRGRE